jgi:DNA-binding transcriptional MerR regulator/quercetin dioxygenase-like cupin family protein
MGAGRAHPHSRPIRDHQRPAPLDARNSRRADGAPRFRISEAARLVGVSASALRLWERQGLVSPERDRSGYRTYGDEDITRLRQVRSMRSERVNAPGIRRLLPSPGDADSSDPRRVDGERLRRLRRQRDLSLRQAAERTGLSVSFISAVERNATGASVATLQRLTSAYDTTVLQLFGSETPAGRLVRPTGRPVLELGGHGVRIEQLATDLRQLEPQLFILAPGASSDGAYAHAGEEFIFVLDGRCTVWVGTDERYRLREGDALAFPSTLPHRWRNDAGEETRLLWINTPPTF